MVKHQFTNKQAAFIQEYPIDLNCTQSAIRAGYSERTANTAGARLYKNVRIKAEIAKLLAERAARNAITADNVLKELATIAFSEEVKMTEKLRGLELLGRHLVLFTDKVVHHNRAVSELSLDELQEIIDQDPARDTIDGTGLVTRAKDVSH